MKILSIRQPWAHLIVNGSKNIENRDWPTSYRGPVLIHASLNIDREGCVAHKIEPSKLPKGGVVGIAEVVDCVNKHSSRWFKGRYGFVLRDRQPLRFVKWKGSLGLRDAPARLLKRISPRVLGQYE
jgi:hypothetical protein